MTTETKTDNKSIKEIIKRLEDRFNTKDMVLNIKPVHRPLNILQK